MSITYMNMKNRVADYSITDTKITKIGRFRVVQSKILKDGEEHPYSYLRENPCVCVFPILNGQVVLIRQYRYAVSAWHLEIPCGQIEEGEKSDSAAKRELFEETGCLAKKLIALGDCFARVGVSDCQAYFYLAECETIRDQKLDPTEQIERIFVSLEEFEAMVCKGVFSQPLGIVCWVRAQKQLQFETNTTIKLRKQTEKK